MGLREHGIVAYMGFREKKSTCAIRLPFQYITLKLKVCK